MTLQDQLIQTYHSVGSNLLETHEFYQKNPLLSKGSIRSALSRMRKKGIIERIDRGVYLLKEIYKRYRHAKRIYDTHKKNPGHDFDLDIEMTAEGLAPIDLTLKEIEDVVNPMLLDRGLEILDEEGIHLYEEMIDFVVVGTQELGGQTESYDSNWSVEVKVVNSSGEVYSFNGFMDVVESEWQ